MHQRPARTAARTLACPNQGEPHEVFIDSGPMGRHQFAKWAIHVPEAAGDTALQQRPRRGGFKGGCRGARAGRPHRSPRFTGAAHVAPRLEAAPPRGGQRAFPQAAPLPRPRLPQRQRLHSRVMFTRHGCRAAPRRAPRVRQSLPSNPNQGVNNTVGRVRGGVRVTTRRGWRRRLPGRPPPCPRARST